MKNNKKIILTTAIIMGLAIPTISSARGPAMATPAMAGFSSTNQIINSTYSQSIALSMPYQEVDAVEQEGLIKMREEEKLARDVYLALFEKWGLAVFDNISQSENRHTEAVNALLDKYGIADPVTDDTPGVFQNPAVQKLYNDLTAQGNISIVEALKVGATIEDMDIYDLNEKLASTDNDDITAVYSNLKNGSENHLRAFVFQLTALGATYTPQYITLDEYNQILTSFNGKARRGR